MRTVLRFVVVALGLAAVLATASPAWAAPSTVGYDVSHPQCDEALPRDAAFGIVGVNGGLSTRANPCLDEQLEWAAQSSGEVAAQPRAQLYLNTANPGLVRDEVTTWPRRGLSPYGQCSGENSTACSWLYGWQRAQHSVESFFEPAARDAGLAGSPSGYRWWLDVETMNTWQSGSDDALDRNRATLEGMSAYLLSRGAEVGVYSTYWQWMQIVGVVPQDSALAPLDSWLAGASDRDDAADACDGAPLLRDGDVLLVQYVADGLDHNQSCV
jgi:hypothetical protein